MQVVKYLNFPAKNTKIAKNTVTHVKGLLLIYLKLRLLHEHLGSKFFRRSSPDVVLISSSNFKTTT